MQERFVGEEVWRNLDVDADECMEYMRTSKHYRAFRTQLFSRIVPTLNDLGLFGDRMRRAFGEMGIIGYEHHDVGALIEQDEKIAGEFDRTRVKQVEQAILQGAADD